MSTIDLDELIEFAATVASEKIVGQKEPTSFYVLLRATGARTIVEATDENRYAEIFTPAGLRPSICDSDTIAYVFVGHALLRPCESGKPFTNTLPGNYPTDREVFVVVATDGVHKHLTQWDIRRDHDGTITALEEFFLDPAEPPGSSDMHTLFHEPPQPQAVPNAARPETVSHFRDRNGELMSTVDLNELLEYAGELVSQQLVGKKQMVALCVLVDATGEREVMGVETGSSRYENISQFAKLRQLMRDRGTVAYAWVSEAWAAPPEPALMRPSEHPDRREVVSAVASDGFNSLTTQWDIRRDYKGSVVALVKSHEALAACGPLTNLLGERA